MYKSLNNCTIAFWYMFVGSFKKVKEVEVLLDNSSFRLIIDIQTKFPLSKKEKMILKDKKILGIPIVVTEKWFIFTFKYTL